MKSFEIIESSESVSALTFSSRLSAHKNKSIKVNKVFYRRCYHSYRRCIGLPWPALPALTARPARPSLWLKILFMKIVDESWMKIIVFVVARGVMLTCIFCTTIIATTKRMVSFQITFIYQKTISTSDTIENKQAIKKILHDTLIDKIVRISNFICLTQSGK